MAAFFKTTILGGILFLLPVAIVLMILGYALKVAATVAEPIADKLQLGWGDVTGIGLVTVLSAVVLVLVSFGAGLLARTYVGARITRRFENSLLGRLPHYQMLKSMAEGLVQLETATSIKPALINIEDAWQMGYLLEPLEKGWSSVFLPQAPTPMSGNVMRPRAAAGPHHGRRDGDHKAHRRGIRRRPSRGGPETAVWPMTNDRSISLGRLAALSAVLGRPDGSLALPY